MVVPFTKIAKQTYTYSRLCITLGELLEMFSEIASSLVTYIFLFHGIKPAQHNLFRMIYVSTTNNVTRLLTTRLLTISLNMSATLLRVIHRYFQKQLNICEILLHGAYKLTYLVKAECFNLRRKLTFSTSTGSGTAIFLQVFQSSVSTVKFGLFIIQIILCLVQCIDGSVIVLLNRIKFPLRISNANKYMIINCTVYINYSITYH